MTKKRILTCALLSIVMLCAAILCFVLSDEEAGRLELWVEVSMKDESVEAVHIWHDETGDAFLFLPPCVDTEKVRIRLGTDSRVTLDGIPLEDKMTLEEIELGRAYTLKYTSLGRDTECAFTVISPSEVSCAYIDTASGSMEYINSKKDNSETGSLRIYSPEGECEYSGALDSVSGRGNYTWLNFEKKPYNIELSREAGILGMEAGRKWVLLANASDLTQLRNELVFSYAEKLGLGYTPERRWVELYLNGEYAGLYQLCEKIETGSGRVDIPSDSVLVSSESADNADTKKNSCITTDAGTLYRVRSENTPARVEQAQTLLRAFERAVMSHDGIDPVTGESWQSMIDIDSFARKYLIEEIFANHDAGYTSGYYYVTKKNGRDVIYAGPVWDYDLSAGNTASWQLQFPCSFFADREYIRDDTRIVVFSSLCSQSEFYEYMTELYERDFSAMLRDTLTETLSSLHSEISKAKARDALRHGIDEQAAADELLHLGDYMADRLEFLDSAWTDGTEYCRVRATQGAGGYYAYIAVKKGEALTGLPMLPGNSDMHFAGWFYEGTDEPFDKDMPVTEDAAIYARWDKNKSSKLDDIAKLAPVAVFGTVLCALGITAVCRMKRGE